MGGDSPYRHPLDVISAAVAPDTTFHAAYTQGCTEACAGDPHAAPDDGLDDQATLAALRGWYLYGHAPPFASK